MSTTGPPIAQAGLTPQIAIVNGDGTPTFFFFRWLLTIRNSAFTAADLEILEAFGDSGSQNPAGTYQTPGEDAAGLFGGIDPAASQPASIDAAALAALFADPAPLAIARPPIRDTLANIPAGLNLGDTGQRFYATDYQHWYRWIGAGWAYDDGDAGSGFIAWFTIAPRTGRWQLCNGAASVSESRQDGTAGLVAFSGLAAGTMPDLITTPTYLRGAGACTGVVVAASNPAFAGGLTGATDLHPAAAAATGGGPGAFLTGFDNPHTHTLPAFAAAGEPRHMDALPYYRL